MQILEEMQNYIMNLKALVQNGIIYLRIPIDISFVNKLQLHLKKIYIS